ncbi:hypothetical protein KBD08_00145 [Candidatus Babeliales bacterium]|nr:hypothetical protein [Candidatus Babeliales bacterium]
MNKWFIFFILFSLDIYSAEPALSGDAQNLLNNHMTSAAGISFEKNQSVALFIQSYVELYSDLNKQHTPEQAKLVEEYLKDCTIMQLYKKPKIYLGIKIFNDVFKNHTEAPLPDPEEHKDLILLLVDKIEQKIKEFYLKTTSINIDKAYRLADHRSIELAYNQFSHEFYMLLLQDAAKGQMLYNVHTTDTSVHTVTLQNFDWNENVAERGRRCAVEWLHKNGIVTAYDFKYSLHELSGVVQQQPWFTRLASISPDDLGGKEMGFLKKSIADFSYKVVQALVPADGNDRAVVSVSLARYLLCFVRKACNHFYCKNILSLGSDEALFWKTIQNKDILKGCDFPVVSYSISLGMVFTDHSLAFTQQIQTNLAQIFNVPGAVSKETLPSKSVLDEFQEQEVSQRKRVREEERKLWRHLSKDVMQSVVAYYTRQKEILLQNYQEHGNQELQNFDLLYRDFDQQKKAIQDCAKSFSEMRLANMRFAQIKAERDARVNALKEFKQQCAVQQADWQQQAQGLVKKTHACKVKYVESELAGADLFGISQDAEPTKFYVNHATQTVQQNVTKAHQSIQTMVQKDPKDDIVASLRQKVGDKQAACSRLEQNCANMRMHIKQQEQDFLKQQEEMRCDIAQKIAGINDLQRQIDEAVLQAEQKTEHCAVVHTQIVRENEQLKKDQEALQQQLYEVHQELTELYEAHQAMLYEHENLVAVLASQKRSHHKSKKRNSFLEDNSFCPPIQRSWPMVDQPCIEPSSRPMPPQARAAQLPQAVRARQSVVSGNGLSLAPQSIPSLPAYNDHVASLAPRVGSLPLSSSPALAPTGTISRHNPYEAIVFGEEYSKSDDFFE